MSATKKVAHISKECVSCGVCVRACPLRMIAIHKGITAVVDESKCVGCSKCAKECPAGVITMAEVARA